MARPRHDYVVKIVWDGSGEGGTSSYASYSRDYRVLVAGKPELASSADAAFRGDGGKHNPEELFVAAIAGCHMLTYLALCAREGLHVLAYEDHATGALSLAPDGGGRFEQLVLSPRVTIAPGSGLRRAEELHARAHELCFIASSSSVPIQIRATVECEQNGKRSEASGRSRGERRSG